MYIRSRRVAREHGNLESSAGGDPLECKLWTCRALFNTAVASSLRLLISNLESKTTSTWPATLKDQGQSLPSRRCKFPPRPPAIRWMDEVIASACIQSTERYMFMTCRATA
ncbi:hypothetical protein DVH05_009749 [Phytophthora capsici]|nr:hypothetical protein DVH05_009749 [Phytophthora capsici]